MDEQSIDDDFNIELGMSQMAKNNFINAQALDADYYAEMSALAKSTGRPVESVMQDAKPAKTELATGLIDFENIVNTNPATSMLMADPHKAKVVGADMPATAKLESAWIGVRDSVDENLFRPLMRGSKNAYANLLLTNKENWLVGWEQNPNIPEWKRAIKRRSFAKEQGQINREIDALPQSADVERGLQEINDATDWQDAAKAIINNPKAVWNTSVESLATSAPTIGLALATGGISRGATAAASGVGSYETEYSSTIKEVLTANGVDFKDDQAVKAAFADPLMMMEAKQKALLRGIPIGVFDAASTYFAGVPLSGAVGTLTSKLSRTFAEFAGQAAFGAAGEKTAQVVTGEDNKGAVLLEAAAEAPSAVFEAKANYKHAGVIATDARIKAEQVDRALKNKEQYDKLSEMSAADKVIKRAPELVAEIVAQATEDTEASHIYVSANDLNQSGLAADVAASSPTVAAEIAQATQNGGMIAIPAAEYATTIANQPWAQDFNNHIRETPDANSAAEAQKIIDTNGAELKADFDLAMQSLDADEVFETSAGTVKDSILADLNGIQAHSASVNEGVATAFSAYYATRAKQLGVTPEALYALRPLSWRSEAGQGDLQQGGADPDIRFSRNADTEFAAEIASALASTAGSTAAQPAQKPSSAKDVWGTIEGVFSGMDGLRQRLEKGTTVVQSADDLPANLRQDAQDAKAQALFDSASNRVYLIADRIEAGQEKAVWLREVFHKRGAELLGDALPRLHSAVKQWANLPIDSVERQIYDAANTRAKADGNYDAEFLPYAIEEAVSRGVEPNIKAGINTASHWLARVRTAFSDALSKFIGRTPVQSEFIGSDLVAAAYGAAGLEASGRDAAKLTKNLSIKAIRDEAANSAQKEAQAKFAGKWVKPPQTPTFLPSKSAATDREWVRDTADKMADYFGVAVTHSGSAAGASSYIILPNGLGEVRVSRHSKGVFNSEFYLAVQDEVDAANLTARIASELGQDANSVIAEGRSPLFNRTKADQTETPAFKAWFKDSKVVDADGKPLVVYHGTDQSFDSFDGGKLGEATGAASAGQGFFFVARPDVAESYANYAALDAPIRREILQADRLEAKGDFDGSNAAIVRAEQLEQEIGSQRSRGQNIVPTYLSIQNPAIMDAKDETFTTLQDEINAFIKKAKKDGRDGVIIKNLDDDPRFSDRVGDHYIAFTNTQIKSAIGNSGGFSSTSPNILKQGATAPRGSFNPDTFTIALLKGADLSTAMHEGAHFFFENDLALASQIVASESISEGEKQLLADVSTLLTWHGITGDIKEQLNTWYSLDREVTREYHEQTAESFERYLLEGKAPSPEMQVYFQKFRAWMLSVYKSVKEQLARNPRGGALNDDVRGVFDRMLATNEQIAQAQQARGMMDMFTTAEAGGMTAEEFAQYQALGREPTNEAIEQMQAKGLKDMAWLHRTKSKAIKRLAKDAAQLRADYRNEAAREVMAQPVYQAWQFLTRKISEADKLPDEPSFAKSKSLDPASDSFIDAIAKLGGLNEDDVKALYGVTRKGYPMKDPVFGKPVLRRKNGLSVEEMALALADNGYLPLDENGNFDTNDFEERFMGELGGSPQYSIYYNYGADEFRSGDQVANPMALGAGRINTAELRAMNGVSAEDVEALTGRKMTVQKGGLHPDIVAEVVGGFDSGDAMVQAILDAQDPHAMIEELVDERMLQEHGELSTPAAIAQAADAAVFNEARLKFATTEANALAKATGQRSVLLAAAKQFAKERLARTTIRNIKPAQFAAASAKAGKAAEAARKAGDIALASAQKRNEVMHTATAKAAYDALTEVDKAVAYFKRVQKSNTLAEDAQAQIADILTKYDLRVSQSGKALDRAESMRAYVMRQLADGNLPEFSPDMLSPSDKAVYIAATASIDEQGNYVYADEAERAKLLADMLDASEKLHYKNMSLEQLRALRENIEQLEHLGKLKNRLLMAKDNRTLDEIKTAIADSIIANASDSGMILPTRDDLPTRVKNAIKNFATSHIRMAVRAFVIDGGKNNGPFWEHFILPANEASNKETALTAEITSKLSAILDPILKDVTLNERMLKGKFYEALGTSLNWQNRFSILLNMGNESNTQRLLSGGVGGKQGITLGQLMPVMSEFSSAEIKAAQQVWDLFESLRPALAELEQATKGKEPEWIPARALNVTSKDGEVITLRGGYYPVVYDQQMSMRLDQEDPTVNVADLVKSVAKATAVTRQSFTKARVDEVHGRPLLLTMDGLYRGLNDVIHDLSFRTYAINSSRLLSSHRIKTALAEHYGMDLVRDMSQFVLELVVSSSRTDAADRAAAFARKNVAMTGLGLNIMNWLQQPFGVTNSIVRLGGGKEGAKWVLRGMQHYFANPMAATADARAKSMFMADRGRTRFRELNEIRNKVQVEGLSQRIAPYLMGGMIFMQQIADSITWHGAVAKAIADDPTLPDSRLYDIADQVVRDSQGGGQDVDLSEMEKGGSVKKLFTVFFNFMNTGNNLAYMSQNTGRDKGTKFADLLLVYAFPVLLSAVMKSALVPSDGDEDWEDMDWADIAKSFAAAQASYLISGMFLVREAQMVVKEVFGEGMGFGYSGPTGLRVIPDAYKFAQQAKQGEIDDAFRKAAINLTGDLTGLPSAQTNRTITGTKALVEGETNNPAAVVFGFSKQR